MPSHYELISCDCGASIVKNYFDARIFGEKYDRYYCWICEFCGQVYKEKQRQATDITPKYSGYGTAKD